VATSFCQLHQGNPYTRFTQTYWVSVNPSLELIRLHLPGPDTVMTHRMPSCGRPKISEWSKLRVFESDDIRGLIHFLPVEFMSWVVFLDCPRWRALSQWPSKGAFGSVLPPPRLAPHFHTHRQPVTVKHPSLPHPTNHKNKEKSHIHQSYTLNGFD